MAKTAGERELEQRLVDLRAQRRAIDAQIRDAQAGLRALRGTSAGAKETVAGQILSLLGQEGALTRQQLAERLGEPNVDKVSRMLSYLDGDKKLVQKAPGNTWELRSSA